MALIIEKYNPRLDGLTPKEFGEQLADQEWRLNNLYWIVDRFGKETIFEMNSVQRKLWDNLWYRNIILKARQHGLSTMIELLFLDCALFFGNQTATVTADTVEHAQKLFKNKIKYAWDRLDPRVKEYLGMSVKASSKSKIEFENGSEIMVSVSARSSTQQLVHISEYAKISVKDPEKAREIKTGTFPSVPQTGYIFIESTAEGREGEFYDLCQTAMRTSQLVAAGKAKETRKTFRFHFFPWFEEESYRVLPEEADGVVIPRRLEDYFNELEDKLDIYLSKEQRVWYMTEEDTLGDDIHREHPSFPDEAFMISLKGAYFSEQLKDMRTSGRMVEELPVESSLVHTFWDIGVNDSTAIIFVQLVEGFFHVIDFYENNNVGIQHYAKKLWEKSSERGYVYGQHFGPHDLAKRSVQTGVTTAETAAKFGIQFQPATRKPAQKIDAIEAAREVMPKTKMCRKHCSVLITHLENYRKVWNQKDGCWSDTPRHDDHSNASDAYQVFGMNHRLLPTGLGRFAGLRRTLPTRLPARRTM